MKKRINSRSVPSFSEAVKQYLTHRQGCGIRPETVKQESSLLCPLVRLLGDKPIDQIAISDIEAVIVQRRAEGMSSNTLNHTGRLSKRVFKWLEEAGMLQKNPLTLLRVIRVEQATIQPMSQEQVEKLLAQLNTSRFSGLRNKTLLMLLYDTGMRVGEALGIRLGDVDLSGRKIGVLGKGKRPRTVYLSQTMVYHLRAYLDRRGTIENNPWLFVDEFGQGALEYTSLRHAIERANKKAGITDVRVSAHTLRHSFAREWCLAGGDVASLSVQLGHSNLEMTTRYVHLLGDDRAAVQQRVSPLERLGGTTPGKKRL